MDKRPTPAVRGDALDHKVHNACAVAGAADRSLFGIERRSRHERSALLIPLGSEKEDRKRA
jgi:hypothetical protein